MTRSKLGFDKTTYLLECSLCGKDPVPVPTNIVERQCCLCLMKVVEKPKKAYKYVSSGKPRGWKFMKVFVDQDGTVYHKGVEQPSLKGTLPPTPKKKAKKKGKKRDKIAAQVAEYRKNKKAAKRKARA